MVSSRHSKLSPFRVKQCMFELNRLCSYRSIRKVLSSSNPAGSVMVAEKPYHLSLVAIASLWYGKEGFDGESSREMGATLPSLQRHISHHLGPGRLVLSRYFTL